MSAFPRRRFLEDSLLAAAIAALPRAASAQEKPAAGRRAGPNDVLRVAVIGVNGRGMNHVDAFAARKDTEIVAICDADAKAFDKAKRVIEEKTKKTPAFVQDIRKLLEDKTIDAVSIATPNHWHSLAAIWAMQAGKDVYVEKPVSHNVHEGRILVETARKHGRICQAGTQSRSNAGMQQLIAFVRSGKIGKVTVARGLCYKPRTSIGKVGTPGKPPPTVDYDLWLGPAPARADVPRSKFHYDWHWQWEYGNGDIGNQGVHEMDKARWGLGKTELPRSVVSVGGRFGYEDDGQTANTQIVVYDYGDAQLIFEVRGLHTDDYRIAGSPEKGGAAKIGNIFHGTEGIVVSGNYSAGVALDLKGQKIAEFKGGGDHFDNFVKAVRSRKHTDLNCDVSEGHLSSALCHLGNISYRLGKPAPFGKPPSAFAKNKNAQEALGRFEEHLKANGVALEKTKLTVGPELAIDSKAERFTGPGSKEANAMLSRTPRKGFAIPGTA